MATQATRFGPVSLRMGSINWPPEWQLTHQHPSAAQIIQSLVQLNQLRILFLEWSSNRLRCSSFEEESWLSPPSPCHCVRCCWHWRWPWSFTSPWLTTSTLGRLLPHQSVWHRFLYNVNDDVQNVAVWKSDHEINFHHVSSYFITLRWDCTCLISSWMNVG